MWKNRNKFFRHRPISLYNSVFQTVITERGKNLMDHIEVNYSNCRGKWESKLYFVRCWFVTRVQRLQCCSVDHTNKFFSHSQDDEILKKIFELDHRVYLALAIDSNVTITLTENPNFLFFFSFIWQRINT